MSLLANPVIQGLLSGGPNALRARAEQERMALAPRGGGGMSGAPGAIMATDNSMNSLGQGLAGLGQGLSAIGGMRKAAAQKEAFDAAIAGLPPEQQAAARLNPEAFAKAQADAMFRAPEKMTTANTALFDVDGKPRRMSLEVGMEQGLPEWKDPPDMKTFGNDVVGYYGIRQKPDGSTEKVDLVPGMGRAPQQVQTVTTADGVFVVKPDGTKGARLGAATGRAPKTVTTKDGIYILSDDGTLGARLGDPEYKPQDALAEFKLEQEKGNTARQTVTQYEDLTSLIQQAEVVLAHPGRDKGTGMSRTLFAPFGITIPGSDVAGFDAQLETLKAKVFLPAVQKMVGMGSLSNAEGQKISASFAALDPNMPDDEFAKSLNAALADLRRAQERVKARLPEGYGQQPAATSASAPDLPPLPPGFVVSP